MAVQKVDPFYEKLESFIGRVIEAAPDDETLMTFAKKYPDKYGSLVKALYSARDGHVMEMHKRHIGEMSDSQLEDAIYRLSHTLGVPAPRMRVVSSVRDDEEDRDTA